MNGKSTISTVPEKDFSRDDAPRLTRDIAESAQLAVGDRVIREGRPRGRPPKTVGEKKEAVSLRLSPSVLTYFRATGNGWQTRMDEALQAWVHKHDVPFERTPDRISGRESVHEEGKPFALKSQGAKPKGARRAR